MSQLGWTGWLAAFTIFALVAANVAFYHGIPQYSSRKVAHFGAAVPIVLFPVVFIDIWFPLALTGAFFLLLVATHNLDAFPGCARKGRWSEILFPLSMLISLAALWPVSPWASIVPSLFLAGGDGITGVVRKLVYDAEVKGNWGSVACLAVCLPIGFLVEPWWIGVLAACAFTVAERYCGDAKGSWLRIDDNIAAPIASLAVMVPLVWLLGGR